jgi:hypothetical protein
MCGSRHRRSQGGKASKDRVDTRATTAPAVVKLDLGSGRVPGSMIAIGNRDGVGPIELVRRPDSTFAERALYQRRRCLRVRLYLVEKGSC